MLGFMLKKCNVIHRPSVSNKNRGTGYATLIKLWQKKKKSSFAFKIVVAFRAYLSRSTTIVKSYVLESLIEIHPECRFIEPAASVKQEVEKCYKAK